MAVMYMNGQTPTLDLMMPFIFMLGVTMIAASGVPPKFQKKDVLRNHSNSATRPSF